MIYLFFRANGFYPVELKNDQQAAENACHNPGTVRVEDQNGRVVWPKPEHKQ